MKMAEWWKAGKAGRTRLQVIVSGDCLEVEAFCEDSDPAWQIRPALGKGTTICRTRKWVGRTAVSVTDRRRSNRLPRRQYGNSGEAACGLDVHQATVVACLLIVLANGKVKKQIRTSGMCMLTALAEGKATPAEMAALAKGRLQEKIPQLEPALDGRLEEHHRYLLKLQLRRMRDLDQDLEDLEARIRERLQPYQEQWALLREIPKVDWTLAAVIIAELGMDMKVFASASQLASWAGLCPGNNESAGKRKSARTTPGNFHSKTALVEAAHAAARTKGTYLRDKYYRLKARRGPKRAAVAVAHKILVALDHMLSEQVSYNDLGDLYLDKLNKQHLTRNLVRRLERLGFLVTLEQVAA